jgi:hypothetical protein
MDIMSSGADPNDRGLPPTVPPPGESGSHIGFEGLSCVSTILPVLIQGKICAGLWENE